MKYQIPVTGKRNWKSEQLSRYYTKIFIFLFQILNTFFKLMSLAIEMLSYSLDCVMLSSKQYLTNVYKVDRVHAVMTA